MLLIEKHQFRSFTLKHDRGVAILNKTKLNIAIGQAQIVVSMLNEGKSENMISETMDIPLDIVNQISSKLCEAEKRGIDRGRIASFLAVLIAKENGS